ncbi:uncharacterized protein LOC106761253 [Vigna radiata var. radiata]|uniref:Uncharacterized protein LOC106761253 n=1 Tax=Vigna radiata var. radiata TaxID=3916 RepID=A0A1S3U2P9_VIGRR|nr:uncharacterized protein LOC106761253 [Vigna radiata var. radiata]
MGKWDNRQSRRFFRHRRSPVRPPKFYDINASLPEYWQDGIPVWEKKYCTTVGLVPWQKIVDSKTLICCHSNVSEWNDSAAEEAFKNAKKRYWAKINSLSCDISLPDPDTYTDQIDWNPSIDPDLIKEIDGALFTVVDEEEEIEAMKCKRTKTSVGGENPWECPAGKVYELKEVNSGNVDNTDNPWERHVGGGNGGLTGNALEGGLHVSWGWNKGKEHKNQCKDWDSGNLVDKGWGKVRDSPWIQQQPTYLSNNIGKSSWQYKSSQQNVTPMKTKWRQQDNGDVSSDLQFRRNYGGWSAQNQGNQWRQNSHRLQRDGRQTGHYLGKEKSKKRDFFS